MDLLVDKKDEAGLVAGGMHPFVWRHFLQA